MRRCRLTLPVLAGITFVGLTLGTLGCGGSGDNPAPTPLPTAQQAADFSLMDVNDTSSTYQASVSPRQYLNAVSAWYYGHAT